MSAKMRELTDEIDAHEKQVLEMRELMNKTNSVLESKRNKFFDLFKKKPKSITSSIHELTYPFAEQELAERRAFLDGYEAGRKDSDSHKAYGLWRQLQKSDK